MTKNSTSIAYLSSGALKRIFLNKRFASDLSTHSIELKILYGKQYDTYDFFLYDIYNETYVFLSWHIVFAF